MEEKIFEILNIMHEHLDANQLYELKNCLSIVFTDCEINKKNANLICYEDCWQKDLEDYSISKTLEGKSALTVDRYKYELNRILSYLNKPVKEIDSNDISNYLRMYKTIRKVKNQTLKNVRAVFSSFFAWLRDRGRITKNPMVLVEDIKVEKRIKTIYSDEERELLLRNCDSLRDKAIMEFLYSTAVRVSELVSLNISDIRFATKDLVVFGKGSKERTVYLNDRANMYLKEYLNTRTDNNPALFVSLKKPHNRLSKEGVEYMIRKTGIKAKIGRAYPHKWRGTSITNAMNRGMPIQEAAVMAGHAKTETTMMYWTPDADAIRYHHKKYLSA